MTDEKKNKTAISVSINPEMKKYLDEHPSLSQSTIFQSAMNRIMNKKKNPLLLMIGVLGVCFGVICLAVATSGILLIFGQEGFIVSAIIFCIGCAVMTASVLTYYKDRK